MDVNGNTRTCGLIGNPVEHTVSPLMQNFFADKLQQPMVYVPFHVKTGYLADAVKGAYALHLLGCNVTVPYKSDVIEYLVEVDELAKKIGAVNTLVSVEGGYKGYNTDISGLYRAMQTEKIELDQEHVLILGAGGVGRAVAFMCTANHAKSVTILNRTLDKAQQLADEINDKIQGATVTAMNVNEFAKLKGQEYLAIQCTNVGMYPNIEQAVIEEDDFYKKIKIGYDLIFNPWETKFMKLAKKNGAKTYNGLKMLLYQGVDAFELWHSCHIPESIAKEAYEIMQSELRK